MDLGRAVEKFSTVYVDGWDGTGWVKSVASGALEVYSRFITERTFGAVKRIFLCHEPIPDPYSVVRMVNGKRYLLSYMNPDIIGDNQYGYTYLLLEVNSDAVVVDYTYQSTASGVGGDRIPSASDPVPAYHERYSAMSSTEVDGVTYERTRILLPKGTVIGGTDSEIQISGLTYDIRESDTELDLVRLWTVLHV